jgi:transposase InsO family protein
VTLLTGLRHYRFKYPNSTKLGVDQSLQKTQGDSVELATLLWVNWYNEERIHGYLDNIPPAEYEDAYHAERSGKQLIGNQ